LAGPAQLEAVRQSSTKWARMKNASTFISTKTLTWIMIAAYMAIRMGLLGASRLFAHMHPPAWVDPVFALAAYTLAAVTICFNVSDLETYNIDGLALVLIVAGKPVSVLLSKSGLPFPYTAAIDLSLPYLLIPIGLLAWLVARRSSIQAGAAPRPIHLIVAFIAGSIAAVVSGLLIRSSQPASSLAHATLAQLALLPVQQFAYAALSEEPFFRGFLWGALREAGLKPGACFITQGGLFWLAHLYYLTTYPLSFWIIVPLGAVVLGLLVWVSRSISTTMIAHGLMNGVGQSIAFYRL
jgi:membrane protease YdiL (CAAX protease family)